VGGFREEGALFKSVSSTREGPGKHGSSLLEERRGGPVKRPIRKIRKGGNEGDYS